MNFAQVYQKYSIQLSNKVSFKRNLTFVLQSNKVAEVVEY